MILHQNSLSNWYLKNPLNTFVTNIQQILNSEERKKFRFLILLDILISILDIAFLAFLLFVIHIYSQPNIRQQYSFLPSWLFNNHSLLLITIFFFLFSLKNFSGFLIHCSQSRFISNVATRLSENQLRKYLAGMYEDFMILDSAVHTRKISHQPIDFSQHILGGIQQIITQSVLILLTVTVMIIFNAGIFLLLFLILLPPVIAVFYVIKNRLKKVKKNSQVSIEKSWQHLQEALSGFVESNIYNKRDFFLQRYIIHQSNFNKYVSDLMIVQGIPTRMIEIFALLGLFFLIAINMPGGASDSSTFITVGAFMAAAYKIIPGIVKILNNCGQINNYSHIISDLLVSKNSHSTEIDAASAKNIRSVDFKNISFNYNGLKLLDNLNFEIRQGDFLGISGCSGSGKTTIINLLLGFLTPIEGEISVNTTPVEGMKLQHYWHHISYAKQQSFLIHDSIVRNIILDHPCNEEKLQEVMQVSGLQEFIDSDPEKRAKIIMENGKNISGGQRQRIAIARALYKDADLIILDEPFNELDESSELSFLTYFQNLSQEGKIIILITHNKQSFSFCNKIVSLDES